MGLVDIKVVAKRVDIRVHHFSLNRTEYTPEKEHMSRDKAVKEQERVMWGNQVRPLLKTKLLRVLEKPQGV